MSVSQGSTRYVQDLAAPLSHILSDGTSTYIYRAERLYAQASGGARLWYASDALGSVAYPATTTTWPCL